jgi:hypothetical protein
MQGRFSITHLLLAAVAMFVLSSVSYADPLKITIGPGVAANTFTFQNQSTTDTAIDFEVVLLSAGPAIGNGFGGAPFPVTNLQGAVPGGGFIRVIYDGGPGIPPNGLYTHSFTGFPVGTQFDVTFSYMINGQRVLMDPFIVVTLASVQGETIATPEPATLLLLGTGLTGIAINTRKRIKTHKK